MTSVEFQVTFDASDPGALAEFWAAVLRYQVQPPPPGFDTWVDALEAMGMPPEMHDARSAIVPLDGATGPRVFFQKVPETKVLKNRVHLDLRAAPGLEGEERMAALESECARLVELGAERIRRVEPDGLDTGWILMTDPEGNEFCLD
ncbi:VOC family protein [Nocardioides gilvus]|uniref:VOC family protein n=1 Tax=Nocardioides gilvus TaxID=1735589 RepID=UPI000D74F560|nr:VOC family protein [Nocardioides gilvus]